MCSSLKVSLVFIAVGICIFLCVLCLLVREGVTSHVVSSWYVFYLYLIKPRFHDIVDHVVVLEEYGIFYLKLVIEVTYYKFRIGFACQDAYSDFSC